RRQSISTPSKELVSNPLEITKNDVQQKIESQSITVEIEEEEKKKLIQKETVQTGSTELK
ncbi:unnamed protein product, partial [Rotaria sordida]